MPKGAKKSSPLQEMYVGLYKDPPMKIMQDKGGAMWDTLFIMCVKDNDTDFLLEFCSRLPCKTCCEDMKKRINDFDPSNKSRTEIIKFLWECRKTLHDKYKDKDLNQYLDYLGIYLEKSILV